MLGLKMTARCPCPPAPGPLEEYAARFDGPLVSLAQRRGFREYLTRLLAPRERNKTITCLARAEPVAGAGRAKREAVRLEQQVREGRLTATRATERILEAFGGTGWRPTAPPPP